MTTLAPAKLPPGPRGRYLVGNLLDYSRAPRFFENPNSFAPDRWTNGLEKRIPKYAYFPFGGGPRLCIGQSFARMEAALLLATIAQRFRIQTSKDQPAIPHPSITLRPKNGIRAVLQKR